MRAAPAVSIQIIPAPAGILHSIIGQFRTPSQANALIGSQLPAGGIIQRLVNALAESHRLSLQTRYQVDYIETLYGLVRSKLAVAILPQLYTTHLQDPRLKVVHLQQPALFRTVALMRAPQALPPLIESCFTLMVDTLRTK